MDALADIEENGVKAFLDEGLVHRPAGTQAYLPFARRAAGQHPYPSESFFFHFNIAQFKNVLSFAL
jgi:hypothetical protein